MKYIKKNTNVYIEDVNKSISDDLTYIIKHYNIAKNYICNRYSSIKSLNKIFDANSIRNEWTKNDFLNNFNIPKRFVRNALVDGIGDIKKSWTNCFDKVRKLISKNSNLSDEEKHFLRYILKSPKLTYLILNRKKIESIKKFEDLSLEQITHLKKLLRRLVRKCLPNKSKFKLSNSIMIDTEMYQQEGLNFNLTGLDKGKRYKLKLNTNSKLSGNLRIKLVNKRIVIYNCIDSKTKPTNNTNKVGVDRNYINVFDSSEGNSYGTGFNTLQNNYTDKIDEVHKKRKPYHEQIYILKKGLETVTDRELKDKTLKKIERIYRCNLGFVKYNRLKRRFKSEIEKKINISIKDIFETEKVKTFVIEELNFQGKNKKYGKKTKHKLSGFVKGIVKDRIEYKCKYNDIELVSINAAYTSQICNKCGHFGVRIDDMFKCSNCNTVVSSGINAALNILKRSDDVEITLNTTPYAVKAILERRLLDKEKPERVSNEPSQPRPTECNHYVGAKC